MSSGQAFWAQVFVFALFVGLVLAPGATWSVLHWAAFAFFAAVIALRCVQAVVASLPPRPPPALPDPDLWPSYALLVPLYREAAVAADLVAALGAIDYPKDRLDIVLLVEADDAETRAALGALALAPPFRVEIVPVRRPRTKPKALNYGLAATMSDLVAVYDAEDRPHPAQLKAAVRAFAADRKAGVVQAPLAIDNPGEGWIAGQFALEYAIQFRVIVPALARLGWPVLLGGTSNHFRREVLAGAGGWDPYNVTEDADLGVRLARRGWGAAFITPPTFEEAPVRLGQWTAQRSRWLKGYLQSWIVISRRPGQTLSALGAWRFAIVALSLLGPAAAALLHLPAVLWLAAAGVGVAPEPPDWDVWLFASGYASLLAAGVAARPGLRGWISLATAPAYWPLHTLAALRAIWELWRRPHYWSKTAHGLARARPPAYLPQAAE